MSIFSTIIGLILILSCFDSIFKQYTITIGVGNIKFLTVMLYDKYFIYNVTVSLAIYSDQSIDIDGQNKYCHRKVLIIIPTRIMQILLKFE